MFQGIVEQKGQVVRRTLDSLEIRPRRPWKVLSGESVAVNGVCLTVSKNSQKTVKFDLGTETQAITNLRAVKKDDWVNLERPLRLGEAIHGHLVLGHVELTGCVKRAGGIFQIAIRPKRNGNAIIPKGCIAVEGVSLTINKIRKEGKTVKTLEFCLVPETLRRTNLADKRIGDLVNIETDYIAKIMLVRAATNSPRVLGEKSENY